jgi:hypothetical protein
MSKKGRLFWDGLGYQKVRAQDIHPPTIVVSIGNDIEMKASKSFDNGVFFNIKAKQTPSIVSQIFSKQSDHIR